MNADSHIDWTSVDKVLLVRLRSIGDTVLSTPTILTLRDQFPDAQIDMLLEDWVAPVLEGLDELDRIITVGKGSAERLRCALELRREEYDIAFNLHGGTTAGFMVRASAARYRVGYEGFQFPLLYNTLLPRPSTFWRKEITHSAENQAAMVGLTGVELNECPKTKLSVTEKRGAAAARRLTKLWDYYDKGEFAVIHPTAATDTKQWAPAKFAEVIDHLDSRGLTAVLVVTGAELDVIADIEESLGRRPYHLVDAPLPEIAAICKAARLFVGNDSGIAHIAAAVQTPTAVIFGSSNVNQWRPWTDAPSSVIREEFHCQPCPGDICREFGEPKCIQTVSPKSVISAVDKLLLSSK
ncbi:MAG: glycosyltransferase family 9 protein [Pyrinomonadaceae bacterium]|nr:glycosyltransferase family 9 protein [Pyrinomonadaceae bacterium]